MHDAECQNILDDLNCRFFEPVFILGKWKNNIRNTSILFIAWIVMADPRLMGDSFLAQGQIYINKPNSRRKLSKATCLFLWMPRAAGLTSSASGACAQAETWPGKHLFANIRVLFAHVSMWMRKKGMADSEILLFRNKEESCFLVRSPHNSCLNSYFLTFLWFLVSGRL